MNAMLNLIAGSAIALVAAYLSSRWTARHAFRQRIWEEKKAEYMKIIASLNNLSIYYRVLADDLIDSTSGTESELERLKDQARTDSETLWQIKNLGDLFISKDAISALHEISTAPQRKWDRKECAPWEIPEADAETCKEIAMKIQKIAQGDLKNC
jgi:hypothetical protein